MQKNRVLIIGNHPLVGHVVKQYQDRGDQVDEYADHQEGIDVNGYDEICIFPECHEAANQTDSESLALLETYATQYTRQRTSHPVCHLLLHSNVTLWLLQTLELYDDINEKFELYAFTLEDQWAKNVFCGGGQLQTRYLPLDREPIAAQSHKTVHLVICGWSDMSESLAIHAALTAHYPNAVRDQRKRTRITIIAAGDITAQAHAFIHRFQHLFDHSYYRFIDCYEHRQPLFHRPQYSATRADFVDIEWEFVSADIHTPVIQGKLDDWAASREQLLTIALCNEQSDHNYNEAFALPSNVYENSIPVLVTMQRTGLMDKVRGTGRYANLYPIGMIDSGYDISLPLLQMAKRLNFFYSCSYGQQGTPTDMPVEQIEAAWSKVKSFSIRYSNIFNVMTIATKMRSLGHDESAWDKFYALNQEEIETISAVEHNRWSVERLILGFRPPTDSERTAIRENIDSILQAKADHTPLPAEDLKTVYKKQKIHYDLCAYEELGPDKTGQNVKVYDYDLTACIPLIANSFKEQHR